MPGKRPYSGSLQEGKAPSPPRTPLCPPPAPRLPGDESPTARFPGTDDTPRRARRDLMDLLACLGRGLGRGEGRKEEVRAKKGKPRRDRGRSGRGGGRSRAGFLGPARRAPGARGGGAGAARGGQWRAALRRGRCGTTPAADSQTPQLRPRPRGIPEPEPAWGRGRPSRAASEHGSRMRRLAPGRGRPRRAAARDPRPAPSEPRA